MCEAHSDTPAACPSFVSVPPPGAISRLGPGCSPQGIPDVHLVSMRKQPKPRARFCSKPGFAGCIVGNTNVDTRVVGKSGVNDLSRELSLRI